MTNEEALPLRPGDRIRVLSPLPNAYDGADAQSYTGKTVVHSPHTAS
jgi:hypothetical protein